MGFGASRLRRSSEAVGVKSYIVQQEVRHFAAENHGATWAAAHVP
jgi:hypothetical protein